jgi:hypothetical protein
MSWIVAENAQRSSIERQVLALDNLKSNPPHGQDPREVTVREERSVAVEPVETSDQSVGPSRDLLWAFAIRAAIPKNVPSQPRCAMSAERRPS